MKESLLTVCIFTYNHENYIARTLESVLCQETSFKFDVMVIDDYSTDNTRAIVDKMAVSDDRIIKQYNDSNLGLNESFILNIPKVKTKYICHLGGDDYWIDSEKLEKQVRLMEKDTSISIVLTSYRLYYENEKRFACSPLLWRWRMPKNREKRITSFFAGDWSYYPLGSSICYQNSCIQKGLQNNLTLIRNHWVGEGTITYVSLCLYGNRFAHIPDITTVYTVRERSLSHYSDKEMSYDYKEGYLKLKLFACKTLSIPMYMQIRYIMKDLCGLFSYSMSINSVCFFKKTLQLKGIPYCLKLLFSFFSYNKYVAYFFYNLAKKFKRTV